MTNLPCFTSQDKHISQSLRQILHIHPLTASSPSVSAPLPFLYLILHVCTVLNQKQKGLWVDLLLKDAYRAPPLLQWGTYTSCYCEQIYLCYQTLAKWANTSFLLLFGCPNKLNFSIKSQFWDCTRVYSALGWPCLEGKEHLSQIFICQLNKCLYHTSMEIAVIEAISLASTQDTQQATFKCTDDFLLSRKYISNFLSPPT